MLICKWEKLPLELQKEEIKPYYDVLKSKNCTLFFKRVSDIFVSFLFLLLFSWLLLIIAVAIKIDSKGPVFYRQERITQYGKKILYS